jgi:carboxyl-terminal processing protease
MSGTFRHLTLVGLMLLCLLTGCVGGAVLDRQVLAAPLVTPTGAGATGLNLGLISEAWSTIHRSYVESSAAQPDKLTYGAISGMVEALGDTGHSTFLTPAMRQQQQNFTQGHFEGIGAEVQIKDQHVVIVAPMDGSPAQKAGLKPGDLILKVNGEDVTGQPLDMVIAKIVGPAGTKVVLSIQSAGDGEPRDVTVTRQRIDVHSVTWAMLPGTHIAHIHIAGFSDGVTKDLQAALTDATKQGATGIVLDLRNNPGGLLSESIGVASEFLRSGNVLQEKDAQGQVTMVPVHPTTTTTDLPMVVLINQGTASASEIVAGALQDAGRARLIGETTFGTGTVLNEFNLSDGSALLLATEEWLTPAGRVIWHQGIVPDSKVALPAQATPLTPEGEQGLTGEQLQKSQDTQLLQGLQVLQKGLLSAHRAAESGTAK